MNTTHDLTLSALPEPRRQRILFNMSIVRAATELRAAAQNAGQREPTLIHIREEAARLSGILFRPAKSTVLEVLRRAEEAEENNREITEQIFFPARLRTSAESFLKKDEVISAYAKCKKFPGSRKGVSNRQLIQRIKDDFAERSEGLTRPKMAGRNWSSEFPSHRVFVREINKFRADIMAWRIENRRKRTISFDEAAKVAGFIHVPNPKPFEVFLIDSTLLKAGAARGDRKTSAPWLTTVVDAATGCVLSSVLHHHSPNRSVVLLALKRAMMPWHLFPGRSFTPRLIQCDGAKNQNCAAVFFAAQRIGARLNVIPKHCPGYNGVLERTFGILKEGAHWSRADFDGIFVEGLKRLWGPSITLSPKVIEERYDHLKALEPIIEDELNRINRRIVPGFLKASRAELLQNFITETGFSAKYSPTYIHENFLEWRTFKVNGTQRLEVPGGRLVVPKGIKKGTSLSVLAPPDAFHSGILGQGAEVFNSKHQSLGVFRSEEGIRGATHCPIPPIDAVSFQKLVLNTIAKGTPIMHDGPLNVPPDPGHATSTAVESHDLSASLAAAEENYRVATNDTDSAKKEAQ